MKKALFMVFSASGNTRKICDLFAEHLADLDYESETVIIRKDAEKPYVNGYDIVCVGYPVHGFNAPKVVLDFAKDLQDADGKGYYIIKTSGEPLHLNDASSRVLKKIMTAKGYRFKGEFHYVMPYNMIFRHSDKMASLMWRAALNTVPYDTAMIAAGAGVPSKEGAGAKAARAVFAVEHAGMPLFGRFFKADAEKCVRCGKCVRLCPTNNITMTGGGIKFGGECLGCTACSFNCPEDAINIGPLNGWKVNGAYRFDENVGNECLESDICRYCRSSYVRYFRSHGIRVKKS